MYDLSEKAIYVVLGIIFVLTGIAVLVTLPTNSVVLACTSAVIIVLSYKAIRFILHKFRARRERTEWWT